MNRAGDGMPMCKYEVRRLEEETEKTDETQSIVEASLVNFGGRMKERGSLPQTQSGDSAGREQGWVHL